MSWATTRAFRGAVSDGMAPGFAAGDGAALHFVGTDLAEVVSSRPAAQAYYVRAGKSGEVLEDELPVRYLGETGADHHTPAGPLISLAQA